VYASRTSGVNLTPPFAISLPFSVHVQVYEPRVGDFDVRLFLSLAQADAYNPLIVGTSKFALPSEDAASTVSLPSLLSSTPRD